MFTRRGFNIDSLTVGETETPEYSRITITMSGDGYARRQLIWFRRYKQIHWINPEYSSEKLHFIGIV